MIAPGFHQFTCLPIEGFYRFIMGAGQQEPGVRGPGYFVYALFVDLLCFHRDGYLIAVGGKFLNFI